jgi:hypothetical protein
MSKYDGYETTMTDQDCLVESLGAHGYPVEVATEPGGRNLVGYAGDTRPQKAEVIIRRKDLGEASNDIGFKRAANGNFEATISQCDSGIGYGQPWLSKVRKTYLEKKQVKDLTAKGYTNFHREEIKTDKGVRVRLTATPPAVYSQQTVGIQR